jgi:hypothetical protein
MQTPISIARSSASRGIMSLSHAQRQGPLAVHRYMLKTAGVSEA